MILNVVLQIFFYWFILGIGIALLMFSCLMFAKFCDTMVSWLSGLRQRFAKPSKD
jgi:hypothetical protein